MSELMKIKNNLEKQVPKLSANDSKRVDFMLDLLSKDTVAVVSRALDIPEEGVRNLVKLRNVKLALEK